MRTLPVTKAFQHIVSSTLDNLRFAFHSQWPWVLLLSAISVAMVVVTGHLPSFDQSIIDKITEENPAIAAQYSGFMLVLIVAGTVAFCSIAVNWHLYVLKDQVPQGPTRYRMDHVVWRYLGNFILIGLLGIFVMAGAGLIIVIVGSGIHQFTVPLAIAVLLVLVVPLIYRFSVKLPAVALGRIDFSFSDAMRSTQDNWWQLVGLGLFVTVLTTMVGVVLNGIGLVLKRAFPDDIVSYIDFVLNGAANWVLTVLGITTLTSLYGFFVEGRDF